MGWLMAYVPMWDEMVEKTETKIKRSIDVIPSRTLGTFGPKYISICES